MLGILSRTTVDSPPMSAQSPDDPILPPLQERLELAQRAFEDYYASCFWFMNRSLKVTEELLPRIAEGLTRYGDRRAFKIASQLCR